MKKKIVLVAAARPNFMKVAPLARIFNKQSDFFEYKLVHTGQHYDKNMSQSFFDQLEIPKPDVSLEVGSGTHAEQTGQVMIKFEKFLMEYQPDLVIVVGDVNSTMACSITAKKLHIKVAHIEAGLRSFDRQMPEEINRLLTDSISDIFYTPSRDADKQLFIEGHDKQKIVFVGNIMIDTLQHQKIKAEKLEYWKALGLEKNNYALLTLHRPSNVDNKEIFTRISSTLFEISKLTTIIFPIHPRTRKMIKEFNLESYFNFDAIKQNAINLIDPLGYNENLSLMINSKFVLTDSGGLQEETTALKIPCITMRENTERPITVVVGSNVLVGSDPKKIISEYSRIINSTEIKSKIPEYWDGKTAERIAAHLKTYL